MNTTRLNTLMRPVVYMYKHYQSSTHRPNGDTPVKMRLYV